MSRVRWYLGLLALVAAPAAGVVGGACGGGSPADCGAGMVLVGDACVPVSQDAGPDAKQEAAAPDAGPDVAADVTSDAEPDVAPQDPEFQFGGVTSASPASKAAAADGTLSLLVTWDEAEDPFTLPADMAYSIYLAAAAKGENYDAPAAVSINGVTSFTVSGLKPGTYFLVVRATNNAGAQDQNTHELSATVAADVTPPKAPGVPTVVPRLACQSRLTWAAATDAQTGAAGLQYNIFLADGPGPIVTSGTPAATTLGATTVDVPVTKTSTPYHDFVVVAVDAAGNTSIPSGVGAPDLSTLSFESSVQPILTNDCAPSCHTVNTTNKFTPVYDDGYAYAAIMGPPGAPVFAHVCRPNTTFCGPDLVAANCAQWLAEADAGTPSPIPGQLIDPGHPECSVLYQVAFQEKMPPKTTGLPPLSACDKSLIGDWIDAGALP